MIKEALQYVVNLGKTETIEIEGRVYSTSQIMPVKQPETVPLCISTLNSLVQYIKTDFDKVALNPKNPLVIHVVSPTLVKAFTPFYGEFKQRDLLLEVSPVLPTLRFGEYKSQEQFVIEMQSKFVDTQDKPLLLQLAGNLKDEMIRTMEDDGVSQVATVKAGVAKVADVVVPNPVTLAPYRTFLEVDQPASKFIFRIKEGGQLALFEADGGAWQYEAISNIKKYLENEVSSRNIVILS